METNHISFREAYARDTGLPAPEFERALFLRCVPPIQRPVARVLLWLNPGVFDRDLATMREVAVATSSEDVRLAARDLRGGGFYQRNLLRDAIGVRASGRRLVAIARRVLK